MASVHPAGDAGTGDASTSLAPGSIFSPEQLKIATGYKYILACRGPIIVMGAFFTPVCLAYALQDAGCEADATVTCYNYLPSGLDPTVVTLVATSVLNGLSLVVNMYLGAYLNYMENVIKLIKAFVISQGCCMILSGITGPNHLWVLSLSLFTVAGCIFDMCGLCCLDFMFRTMDTEKRKTIASATGQMWSLIGQLVVAIVVGVGLQLVLGLSNTLAFQVGTAFAGLLCIVWGLYAVSKWPSLEARLTLPEGVSMRTLPFVEIKSLVTEIRSEYPQVFRMLLATMFNAAGVTGIVGAAAIYFQVVLELKAFDVSVVFIIVLVVSSLGAAFARALSKRYHVRTINFASVISWLICILVYPVICNGPGQTFLAWAASAILGFLLGMWYASNPAFYSILIPKGKEGKYWGVYSFMGNLLRWLPPLVYSSIVQATRDHQIAVMHAAIYFFFGLLMVWSIKLDTAAEDIKRGSVVSDADAA